MSEFSESVYLRADDRQVGVTWLKKARRTGYVLEPRGGWVQCLLNWRERFDYTEKNKAIAHAPGLAIYYCYAADTLWSFIVYHDGEPLFGYECSWEDDEYHKQGVEVKDLADLLDIPADRLQPLIFTGDGDASWEVLADNAASFADLLELPNYAFASFEYAHPDAEATGMIDSFVDPHHGGEEDVENADDAASDEPTTDNGAHRKPPPGAKAPWDAAYELASNFLKSLHDEELMELSLDTRLVRDRLIERLTKQVIYNPVSNDKQLVHHWLEALMDAPEIVDVYATDEALLLLLRQTMEEMRVDSDDA